MGAGASSCATALTTALHLLAIASPVVHARPVTTAADLSENLNHHASTSEYAYGMHMHPNETLIEADELADALALLGDMEDAPDLMLDVEPG